MTAMPKVIPETPPEYDRTRIVERPDGYYWQDKDGGREYGPFATLLEAVQDMELGGDRNLEPGDLGLVLVHGKATDRAVGPGVNWVPAFRRRTVAVYPSRELSYRAGSESPGGDAATLERGGPPVTVVLELISRSPPVRTALLGL